MKSLKPSIPNKQHHYKWLAGILKFMGLDGQLQRSAVLDKLQYQRFLLRSGLDAKAYVLEIEIKGVMVNNLREVTLLLGLHFPGNSSIDFVRTTSIVDSYKLPRHGEKISVRFNPDNTSAILIL